jgi:hypothetical protein
VLLGRMDRGSAAVGRGSRAEKAAQRQPQAEAGGPDDRPRIPVRVLRRNAGHAGAEVEQDFSG